jgi:hypothetical protein
LLAKKRPLDEFLAIALAVEAQPDSVTVRKRPEAASSKSIVVRFGSSIV